MPNSELLRLSAQIVIAHAKHNKMATDQLTSVIRTVYTTLKHADAPEEAKVVFKEPAVPIKKSVFPDHIVCLEDGKKMKMLRRHLATAFGMTPDEYRAKWKLPSNYPMVAPNYSEHRSSLAKTTGLGRKVAENTPIEVQKVKEGVRGKKLAKAKAEMVEAE